MHAENSRAGKIGTRLNCLINKVKNVGFVLSNCKKIFDGS